MMLRVGILTADGSFWRRVYCQAEWGRDLLTKHHREKHHREIEAALVQIAGPVEKRFL